jgi:hypothetical protein
MHHWTEAGEFGWMISLDPHPRTGGQGKPADRERPKGDCG